MKRLKLFLLATCTCLFAGAQKKDKRECGVITAYLENVWNHYPYHFESWSLPIKSNAFNLAAVINTSLFRDGLIRPEDNIQLDSPITTAEARYMLESCLQNPQRHQWNSKMLTRLGVHLGDTTDPPSPPSIQQMSVVRIRMTRPLFSEDGNKALFYGEYSSENGGGEGSVWLFIKEGRKWRPAISLNIWIE